MNWKVFGATVQVLSATNFLNSPELYNFLQGKQLKFLSQAKDICSLIDFLVWLNTSISTSLSLHSIQKKQEREDFDLQFHSYSYSLQNL